jgi:hypothetical protein
VASTSKAASSRQSVEQCQALGPRHLVVVPLEQELHRGGDPGGGLGQPVYAEQAQYRGADPGFRAATKGMPSPQPIDMPT